MTDAVLGKNSINLLRPELTPELPLWTLKRVFFVWGLVLLLMVGWVFYSEAQLKVSGEKYNHLNTEKSKLASKLIELEENLLIHKPSSKLKEQTNLLKVILDNKVHLHKELTDTTKTQVAGFAQSMTELSENHHKGISLQTVQINNEHMTFSGMTKAANYVPEWLAAFEHSTFLSGKKFVNFILKTNEKNDLTFVVSSNKELEDLNNE